MNYLRFAAIGGVCAMLSACGGGGDVASTPAPPTARNNSSLTNLQYSEDFESRVGYIQYSLSRSTGGATPRGYAAGVNAGAQVRYDANSQSYTLLGGALPSSTFTPANRLAASSGPVLTAYQKTAGNKQENLALFNPGAANTELALTYVTYGALQTITDNGTALDVDTSFFTYGIRTAASDMPRTGSATYLTKIDGQFADSSGVYVLGGTSSFGADFAAGTIAVRMTPVGQNVVTGGFKYFDPQSVNGSIHAAPFSYEFSGRSNSGTYTTTLNGYFYGPAAAEVGATFVLAGGGGAGAGALVGKKD